MSTIVVLCLLLTGGAADIEELGWSLHFRDLDGWTRQPAWLGNASPTAAVTTDGETACFAVQEARLGMKWSLAVPAVAFDETPFLVVRYRAENVATSGTDYVVYLDDRVAGRELSAVRLRDAKADGAWHEVAVDLSALTSARTFHTIAVQVQAGQEGKARLWIDWITLAEAPPDGAEELAAVPKRPDWVAPLGRAQWTAQPTWLANPAPGGAHAVERSAEATTFRVRQAGCGMKWSWPLEDSVALAGYRYVSMRYRAGPSSSRGDYALAVLGARRGPGMDYEAAIAAEDLVCDGRWHVLDVDLRRTAAVIPAVTGLAVQLQTSAPDGVLEIADLRFSRGRRPGALADTLQWRPAEKTPEGFRTIALGGLANARAAAWRRCLRLADWFSQESVVVQGVPFALALREPELAATTIAGTSELRIPVETSASEVYLLVLAVLRGEDEPVYGGGTFKAIRDVDRFRLRLEYAGGQVDECLPLDIVSGVFGLSAGPQVVVAAADPTRRLASIVLCDGTKQGAFAVAAVSVRVEETRLFPAALEETPPLRRLDVRAEGRRDEAARAFQLDSGNAPALTPVRDSRGMSLLAAPSPLVELRVDGNSVPADALERLAPGALPPAVAGQLSGDARWYRVRTREGLALGVAAVPAPEGRLSVAVRVHNAGPRQCLVGIVAPRVGPYRLAESPEDEWYLVPKRSAALDNRPCSFRERYCGLFPLQFLDTFSPGAGRGLALRTCDASCLPKYYLLEKDERGLTLGVEYPARTLGPGETLVAADAVLAVTDGDWHRGLEAYRAWVGTWYRPASPRKPWFREVFNFRQRFLWGLDPLYDARTGKLDLGRALQEARREFGGLEYLHLFDWGNCGPYGRIYGRTGDYSPFDYIEGGRDALRDAIAGVQAQGVPVGLYIEAYLLEERGKLGQAHGKEWQLIRGDGSRARWPDSSELYVCSFVPAWREVQASTYAAKVQELGADGMYLDEYGFAAWVDCHSAEHGHAVPGFAVAGERDSTRLVRERIESVKGGVALYSEETPVDVTTQYQDGSFTYALSGVAATRTRVPLNLTRFALPDFKTIEILYCDKPTGSWSTGVKWVFFNGEALWLEGPAAEWFEPETRATIRRCHAVLRAHRDAFTSPAPIPLVPTEAGGVWANAFPAPGKTVYTLYNARHSTVRGELLRVPAQPGARLRDEWNGRPALFRREGGEAIVSLELGPNDVGCLVVEP